MATLGPKGSWQGDTFLRFEQFFTNNLYKLIKLSKGPNTLKW